MNKEVEDPNNYYFGSLIEIKKEYDVPDKKLTFLIEYDKEQDYETAISELQLDSDSTNINENSNGVNIKFNYDLPLKNDSKFSFGYDAKITNNSENMNFELTNDDLSRFSGKVDFDYKRDIHSLFADYNYVINEKISIKPSCKNRIFRQKHRFREKCNRRFES